MGSQLGLRVELKLQQVGKPELIAIELIFFELLAVQQRFAKLRPQLFEQLGIWPVEQRQRPLASGAGWIRTPGPLYSPQRFTSADPRVHLQHELREPVQAALLNQ